MIRAKCALKWDYGINPPRYNLNQNGFSQKNNGNVGYLNVRIWRVVGGVGPNGTPTESVYDPGDIAVVIGRNKTTLSLNSTPSGWTRTDVGFYVEFKTIFYAPTVAPMAGTVLVYANPVYPGYPLWDDVKDRDAPTPARVQLPIIAYPVSGTAPFTAPLYKLDYDVDTDEYKLTATPELQKDVIVEEELWLGRWTGKSVATIALNDIEFSKVKVGDRVYIDSRAHIVKSKIDGTKSITTYVDGNASSGIKNIAGPFIDNYGWDNPYGQQIIDPNIRLASRSTPTIRQNAYGLEVEWHIWKYAQFHGPMSGNGFVDDIDLTGTNPEIVIDVMPPGGESATPPDKRPPSPPPLPSTSPTKPVDYSPIEPPPMGPPDSSACPPGVGNVGAGIPLAPGVCYYPGLGGSSGNQPSNWNGDYYFNPSKPWIEVTPQPAAFSDTCIGGYRMMDILVKNVGYVDTKFRLPEFNNTAFLIAAQPEQLDPLEPDPNGGYKPRTITLRGEKDPDWGDETPTDTSASLQIVFVPTEVGAANGTATLYHITGDTTPIQNVSITRSGTVATVVTTTAHGLTTGEMISIAGTVAPEGYGGGYIVRSTPDETSYTINVDPALATPATDAGSTYKNVGELLYTIVASGVGLDDCEPDDTIKKHIRLDGDIPNSGNLNFLEQATSTTSEKSVVVTNIGNVPVRLISSTKYAGSDSFTIGATDITLAVDGSISIPVTFAPTEQIPETAIMRIEADATNIDPDGHAYLSVFGKGVAPGLPLTKEIRFDGSLSFGGAFLSEYKELAITITAVGSGSVLVKKLEIDKPFTLIQPIDSKWVLSTDVNGKTTLSIADAQYSLLPGSSTSPIIVRFTPTVAGEFNSVITADVEVTAPPTTHPADGVGVMNIPEEEVDPGDPTNPPDPDPGSDPPTAGESALDGVGNTCITKNCEVSFLYKYEANKPS